MLLDEYGNVLEGSETVCFDLRAKMGLVCDADRGVFGG